MPAELEHGLGDEYHLDEVDEDNHEVEDSQNVGLIDDEIYDEDSEVSDEDYNSLGSISPTQVPRLGVGLTSTQLYYGYLHLSHPDDIHHPNHVLILLARKR